MTYKCYNREPFKSSVWVQDGWTHSVNASYPSSRLPRMAWIPFRMAASCQYSKDDKYADPGCTECKHNQRTQNGNSNPA